MKKLHELLKLPLSAGDIGIEIETEGENLYPIMDDVWKTEDDGSLRGRFPTQRSEYVLRNPIKIRNVDKALETLQKSQKEAEIKFSFRCSSHVHVNVGDLTYPEFLAYLYLVILLEAPLMSYCGESRIGNRFCLRLLDAEGYMNTLRTLFEKGPASLRYINATHVRYSAINIASINKYGSLEFRGMHGTMDEEILVPWCQTLYRLREVARKFGDPIAVHDNFVSMSNINFAKKHLGKNSNLFNLEVTAKEIDKSFSLAIELPYAYKEYEQVKKPIEEVEDDYPAPPPIKPRAMPNPVPAGWVRLIDEDRAQMDMEEVRLMVRKHFINGDAFVPKPFVIMDDVVQGD